MHRLLPLAILAGLVFSTSVIAAQQRRSVTMTTSRGTIQIELYPDKAPATVKNFLQYVEEGFYDGTLFHLVVRDFVIQGGGFLPEMKRKQTRAPIVNEANNGLHNTRGTIAAAHKLNQPNSATSEFFINVKDNPDLDPTPMKPGYCVFGRVMQGMAVVDQIAGVPVGEHWQPKQDVIITKVKLDPPAKARVTPLPSNKAPGNPASKPKSSPGARWMGLVCGVVVLLGIVYVLFQVLGDSSEGGKSSGGYTMISQSKSCGACGRGVSLQAQAGGHCPHCGAYWGSERRHYRNL